MVQVVTHSEFEALANEVRALKNDLEIYKSLPFAVKLVSREQAAKMLNKSIQTIDNLVKRNELGYIKGERSVDITVESVIVYLKKMHIKPQAIAQKMTQI